MAEIRVERKERRGMLPWILGLLLLALVLWGIAEMTGRDNGADDAGASAVGTTIQQQPPALRQYAVLTTEVLTRAA